MRNIAIGILIVILAAIILEPLTEMIHVMREKIVVGTALMNASRVARDRSLEYELLRGLDARIDEARFREYYADAFEQTLNLTLRSSGGRTMIFSSNDGKYHDITVTLDFLERFDPWTEQLVTEVNVKAETAYRFKTKFLKLAEAANRDVGYQIVAERNALLSVRN